MEKKLFVTKEQLEEISKTYPTPFYVNFFQWIFFGVSH